MTILNRPSGTRMRAPRLAGPGPGRAGRAPAGANPAPVPRGRRPGCGHARGDRGGGLTWRAVSQGVFATGTGPAYAAWDQWNPPGRAPLNLARAAVLAASAHPAARAPARLPARP